MTEHDPHLARVSMDVPRRVMPELMERLGEFTLTHGIAVRIDDEETALTPYDTKLVSTVEPVTLVQQGPYYSWQDSGERIAAVTADDVKAYARSIGKDVKMGTRALNTVANSLKNAMYNDLIAHVKLKPSRAFPITWTIPTR